MKSVATLRSAAIASGLLLLAAQPASASIDCTVSASGVAFGTYDPLATASDDSTGTITVSCSYFPPGPTEVNYSVILAAGNSGTPARRELRSGPAQITYNLFDSAARAQVWGDGRAGTVIASGSFQLGPAKANRTRQRTHTIYGRLPALQDAPPGQYTDSIFVTLTF
jgi:spore coat protein U-like protein